MGRDRDSSESGLPDAFNDPNRSLTPHSARRIVTSGASEIVVDDFINAYLKERPKTIPEISLYQPPPAPEPAPPPAAPTGRAYQRAAKRLGVDADAQAEREPVTLPRGASAPRPPPPTSIPGTDEQAAQLLLDDRDRRISQLEDELSRVKGELETAQRQSSPTDLRASSAEAQRADADEPRTVFRPAAPPRPNAAPKLQPMVKTMPMSATSLTGGPVSQGETVMMAPVMAPPPPPRAPEPQRPVAPAPAAKPAVAPSEGRYGSTMLMESPLVPPKAAPPRAAPPPAPPIGITTTVMASVAMPKSEPPSARNDATMMLSAQLPDARSPVSDAPGAVGMQGAPGSSAQSHMEGASPSQQSGLTPAPFFTPIESAPPEPESPFARGPNVDLELEKPLPKSGKGKWIALALASVIAGVGSFAFLRGLGPFADLRARTEAKSTPPAAFKAAASASPVQAPSASATAASTADTRSSANVAASSAPSASAASPVESAAPSAVAPTAGDSAPPAVAATPEQLKALLSFQAYLTVRSPADATVVAQGQDVGRTNQLLVVRCGPRNVRLRGGDRRWLGDGLPVHIDCMQHTIVVIPPSN